MIQVCRRTHGHVVIEMICSTGLLVTKTVSNAPRLHARNYYQQRTSALLAADPDLPVYDTITFTNYGKLTFETEVNFTTAMELPSRSRPHL